jgi:hypothetical protein
MRRTPAAALDRMKFLQALASGLRAELLEVGRDPLPEHLAMLVRRLESEPHEHSGEECEHGTRRTQTSSRIGR